MSLAQTGEAPPEDGAPPALPVPGVVAASEAGGQVRLGISVSKPSKAVYAQLPKLPRGSGFLLSTVHSGGAADLAGLKPMDVLWKLGDQILINESQMMVLLSLHRPGDKVTVSYFHSGKEKEATLQLQGGRTHPPHPEALAMAQPFPGALAMPPLPMRVISYEDRSASISDNTGTATLTFREGKPWLHVESPRGEETFNGYVAEASDLARVPVSWRGRLPILQRSLKESVHLRRLPRVRRVPTPKQRFAGGSAGDR
ncbi:MAG: PDZ domain-containing protein [Verrucomicrobiae bacterium]|nr:PDZ domain-containing protein [Verrucomicrobiae bacterium]NNJ44229.1 PDZ domain-containing protein [Akkermansiaceae bacterium]